jgi:hypothetical protein
VYLNPPPTASSVNKLSLQAKISLQRRKKDEHTLARELCPQAGSRCLVKNRMLRKEGE